MGNMGMAENEYHQKMLRLGQADAEQVAATDPAYEPPTYYWRTSYDEESEGE